MKPICVICTEELIADSNVSVIHCGHLFHEVCLNKWLSNGQNDTCPQCRYTATPEKVIKKLFFTNLESQESKESKEELSSQSKVIYSVDQEGNRLLIHVTGKYKWDSKKGNSDEEYWNCHNYPKCNGSLKTNVDSLEVFTIENHSSACKKKY